MSPRTHDLRDRRGAAELVPLLASLLVCLAGGLSLAGWLFDIPELVQLDPIRGLTVANEAAALLACGMGVLAARGARDGSRLAAAFGGFVMALCAATLAEILLDLDVGLDQLLVADRLSRPTAHPGRMAPNTAIALLLAGGALVAVRRMPAASGLLGGLCAAIGATALLGYWTGVEPAYGWARWPSVSVASAVCLVLLGIATWPLANARDRENPLVIWRGPLVAGVACASVTLLFWQALVAREEEVLGRLVESGARRAEAEIRSGIAERGAGLTNLAREWEGRFLRLRGAWESDARLLLAQAPELAAIEWIDRSGDVKWVYPEGVRLPAPRVAGHARRTSRPELSGPLALGALGPGFRALVPLRDSGEEPEGWLSGVYQGAPLFADVLADLDGTFLVEVSSGGDRLFRSAGESSRRQRELAAQRRLELPGGLALQIRVEPSRELMAGMRSGLPPVLVAAGLSMSLLLALALGLRGVAAVRAAARDREAGAREAAAREVERLNAELEARVLARTAELARSNESLGRFASFLSHELRQPLGAQMVWADLLQTKHSAELDADGRRCVSELRSGAERMSELLDAQLALSRGESAPAHGAAVDLTSLANEVIRGCAAELDAIGASVALEPLPAVRGDAQQLARLLRNLLENAIKYRSPEHPLRVRLHGSVESGDALIRVEDNGRGFPLAEAERIFEPAVRLDPESCPGEGIGLALCRQIVASHRGWIRARGTPGGGAVFTVLLPAAEPMHQ